MGYYDIPRMSYSKLKHFEESPAHFKWAIDHPMSGDTPALSFGRAIHSAILEPELFKTDFEIKLDGRTASGKEQASRAFTEGKTLITKTDAETIQIIQDKVFASEKMRNLIKGQAEKEYFYEIDGVEMKSKMDLVTDRFILDIKSCQSAKKRDYQRSVVNYLYYAQAWLYQYAEFLESGIKKPFIHLAIEKTAPFEFAIYHLDDFWIELGEKKVRGWIAEYKKCTELNQWEGYSRDIQSLDIPQWLINEMEEK